eukprot:Gb_31463 [translate_table: standard]
MRFFSRGSRRGARIRGHQPRNVWEQGRRKRIRFSIHLDADSDEFHRFSQTGHLYLGPIPTPRQSIDTHLPPPPLQPHPKENPLDLIDPKHPELESVEDKGKGKDKIETSKGHQPKEDSLVNCFVTNEAQPYMEDSKTKRGSTLVHKLV